MKLIKYLYPFFFLLLIFLILPFLSNKAFADTNWHTASVTNVGSGGDYLYGVSAASSTDAWTVGFSQQSPISPLIEHWSSSTSTWTQQTASLSASQAILYGVKALSTTNVWAVGFRSDSNYSNYTSLILHTTDGGNTWTEDTADEVAGDYLYGIDGDPASGDAWAIGSDSNGNPITLHLASGHFSLQSNISNNANVTLEGVSEFNSNDVLVVGQRLDPNTGDTNTFTMHFDGSNWTEKSSPNLTANSSNTLTGVTYISSTDAWAVGYSYTGTTNLGTLIHWNGSSWDSTTKTVSAGVESDLDGVAADSAGNISAVGEVIVSTGNGFFRADPLVWHSPDDGANWYQQTTDLALDSRLKGVALGSNAQNIMAAGTYYDNSIGVNRMLIEQFKPKTPLIFIPGVMGSKLAVTGSTAISDIPLQVPDLINGGCTNSIFPNSYHQGDLIWINESVGTLINLPPCFNYLDVLLFNSSGNPVYSQVGLNGAIPDHPYNNTTIPYLIQQGYTPGVDLFIHPYDWRKDIDGDMTAFDTLVNSATSITGSSKVDLLTHSMGGLVARDYISNSTRAGKVNKLVELAPPLLGAPKMLAQLLYDTCPVTVINDLVCIVNGEEANKLVQNMPGTFELLPSRKYYNLPTLVPYNNTLSNNNEPGLLNYDNLKTLLESSSSDEFNKNSTLLDLADNFHGNPSHSGLDDTYSTATTSGGIYTIAGSGIPTWGQLFEFSSSEGTTPYAITVNGDTTVPYLSATLGNSSNVYYTNQKHEDMATGPALTMAVDLLDPNGPPNTLPTGVSQTPFQVNGTIVEVHSPTLLNAYGSNGEHTGSNSAGFIEEGIPGSTYDELGSSKYIFLPSGGTYNISTKPISAGTFDLKVTTYVNDVPTKELFYNNVPQTAQTTSSMSLSGGNTTLSLDVNGDGSNVQSLSPDYNLTGSAAADVAPPFTVASLSATVTSGTYSDPVTVTLAATASGGFSVANTYYKIDGGSQHTYTSPFTVTGNGSHTIIYWSVDSAGLTEDQNTKTFTIASYTLSGNVYVDANQNGVKDSGESGYNGATVSLNTGQSTTTDSSGNYSFASLPSGTYTETLTVPSGYTATTTNPASVAVSSNTTQNFGIAASTPTPTPTPVTATAGYTSTNGNYDSGNIGMLSSTQVTTGSVSGTSQSISIYIGTVGSSPHNHIQVGIYSDNGSNAPGTLLGESAITTLTANSWNTISLPDVAISASTKYFLTFNVDSASTHYAFNSQSTGLSKWKGSTDFGVWPDSYGTPSDSDTTRYAIYLTYVNSSASPTPTPGTVTAGYTTQNGSTDTGNNNQLSATQIRTGAVSGTSQSISVYVGSVTSSPHNHMQVGIYSDNGSDKPGSLLGSSSTQTLTANSWNTISLTGVSISANTKYFLVFNVDGSTTQYGWSNNSAGASYWRNSTTYGTWPSSFGTPSFDANQQYAIYLTY